MELATLALAAATLVAKSFIDAAAQDAGKGGWSGAHRLYELVRQKLSGKPAADTLDQLKTAPHDNELAQTLSHQLEAQAAEDSEFRERLEELVADADKHEPVASIVNQFYGTVRIGKQVTIGDVHGPVTF